MALDIPGATHLHSGKVRDLYTFGDDLLMVASDRISAYDFALEPGIPDKGEILTRLSLCDNELTAVNPALGQQGLFVWHGNYYALPLTERLGLEPDGMIRVGIVHYNTLAEVDRLLAALRDLA